MCVCVCVCVCVCMCVLFSNLPSVSSSWPGLPTDPGLNVLKNAVIIVPCIDSDSSLLETETESKKQNERNRVAESGPVPSYLYVSRLCQTGSDLACVTSHE